VLNSYADYRLAWTLDAASSLLNVTISAPASSALTWAAIGFRPKSRSREWQDGQDKASTHTNFGMEGADIVVGSSKGGVRTMFAELYTGPPIASTDLEIAAEEAIVTSDGRVQVSFSRPLVGGYLATQMGASDATIVSPLADIIWAVGNDDEAGGCAYHDNRRGLRFVDWENPETTFVEEWKCTASSAASSNVE